MKILFRLTYGLVAFSLMGAPHVSAHHSFAATYDVRETVQIEGTVISFRFRNPHVRLDILVADEEGNSERWSVEWGAATALGRDEITLETLRPGDFVQITGNPGRSGKQVRMNSITRPSDGWSWSGDVD